jgi:hypothetical protein
MVYYGATGGDKFLYRLIELHVIASSTAGHRVAGHVSYIIILSVYTVASI